MHRIWIRGVDFARIPAKPNGDPAKLIEIQAGKHSKSAKSRGSRYPGCCDSLRRIRIGCASPSGVLQASPVWDLSSACLVRDLAPLRSTPPVQKRLRSPGPPLHSASLRSAPVRASGAFFGRPPLRLRRRPRSLRSGKLKPSGSRLREPPHTPDCAKWLEILPNQLRSAAPLAKLERFF